jgi:L-threonylcarbamoyladenylate synthase
MKIVKADKENYLNFAIDSLEKGQLIIYPTETCYGLGADAQNPKAIDKLLKYKGNRKRKPVSIAVSDKKMANNYAVLNPTAKNIFSKFLPGPITVVANGKHKVDSRLESETGTLGIRYPDHPIPKNIIKKFKKPITATSANVSGGKTPYSVEDILSDISDNKKKLIGLIIDAGTLERNPPSVVINTTGEELEILRRGKIDFSVSGSKSITSHSEEETILLGEKLMRDNFDYLNKGALVFALQGELGSGKTRFAKGIGNALGINEVISSPTYTFANEYQFGVEGRVGTFIHIDAWRAEKPEVLETLGFDKMLSKGNVIAVEWAEKGVDVLKKYEKQHAIKIIWVKLEHNFDEENIRRVTYSF